MSLNSSALEANDASSFSRAGSSAFVASSRAARWTALGNTSLEDWPMFTWSLGCAPSPAIAAMTSFAFMFDEVPEPVWKTSIGNWSSCAPSAISSAAAAIRCASSPSSRPSSALVRAVGDLVRRGGDPLRQLAIEQAELRVGARGRALDPAEPAHDRHGHPLARHGEVRDGLTGLAAPQLLRAVLHAHDGPPGSSKV